MVKRIYQLLIFFVVVLYSLHSIADEKYSPKNCEYTAAFSSNPKVQDVHVQGYFHQSATLIIGNSVMRASCSIFNDTSVFDVSDSAIIEWATNWALNMGLKFPEITMDHNNFGKVVTVKGAKNLQIGRVIYKGVIYHGKYSRMVLVVGAPSNSYPTKEIMAFLRSIHRN